MKGIRSVVPVFLLAFLLCFSLRAEGMTLHPRTWEELQEALDECAEDEIITLEADITSGGEGRSLHIPVGKSVILHLNGFTIDRNLHQLSRDEGSVLSVPEGSILTIRDKVPSEGIITGGYSPDGAGIYNRGIVILEGGTVRGNHASHNGGGIVNHQMLVIKGGTVTGNQAGAEGGGIYNSYTGSCMLSGDGVYENEAPTGKDLASAGSLIRSGESGVQGEQLTAVRSFTEMYSVIPILVLLLGLTSFVGLDSYLNRSQKKAMFLVIALVFSLILQNFAVYRLGLPSRVHPLRRPLDIYGYAVRPAILASLLRIVRPEKKHLTAWVLVGANALVYLTAFFAPWTFSYTLYNNFKTGPLNPVCLAVSAFLFGLLVFSTIRVFQPHKRRETWVPLAAAGVIAGAVFLDYHLVYDDQPIPFLTMGVVISCVFYYVWLHLQFVREHERALIADQQIQIMKTQIQPHFVFNALSTIRSLCAKDPDTAIYAIEQFSICLRQNLESIESSDLIPFAKELAHTRAYVEIEKLRFPSLQVSYSIEDEGFELPALTIQPLVENAIRHGVRVRKKGMVSIRTSLEEKREHVIVIEDNGIGFDVKADGAQRKAGTHIGLSNVRERLRKLCGGTLTAESEPGAGTRITLRIPCGK